MSVRVKRTDTQIAWIGLHSTTTLCAPSAGTCCHIFKEEKARSVRLPCCSLKRNRHAGGGLPSTLHTLFSLCLSLFKMHTARWLHGLRAKSLKSSWRPGVDSPHAMLPLSDARDELNRRLRDCQDDLERSRKAATSLQEQVNIQSLDESPGWL